MIFYRTEFCIERRRKNMFYLLDICHQKVIWLRISQDNDRGNLLLPLHGQLWRTAGIFIMIEGKSVQGTAGIFIMIEGKSVQETTGIFILIEGKSVQGPAGIFMIEGKSVQETAGIFIMIEGKSVQRTTGIFIMIEGKSVQETAGIFIMIEQTCCCHLMGNSMDEWMNV